MSGPTVTREQKIALWRILADGTWKLKKEILAIAWQFVAENEYSPRQARSLNGRAIRAVCAAEPNRFLSSQKGYKRTDFATDDEINTAIADLRSRIKCLSERSEALERVLDERNQKQAVLL